MCVGACVGEVLGCAVARVGLLWGAWVAVKGGPQRLVACVFVGVCCGVMRVGEAGLMHGSQSHTCAVLSGGAVKCWGLNDYGQVIALAGLRGGCACAGRCFCADNALSGWR